MVGSTCFGGIRMEVPMPRALQRLIAPLLAVLPMGLFLSSLASAVEPQATATYAGQFTSDALTLHLTPASDGSYSGEIHFKDHTYPVHATGSAGELRGTFDTGGDSFPFTASFDGGVLTFATGGKSYRLQRGQDSDNARAQKMVDFTLRDDEPEIRTDAVHLRVPEGWWVKGRVLWGLTALSPARILLCAGHPNGPEMWTAYPAQSFVWRDNFNLFGLSFPLRLGDADPMTGEEIERPLPSAADCIRQVIVPRYRKDLADAKVISSKEYSADDAARLEKSILGDAAGGNMPGVTIVHRAAVIRVEYRAGERPVQEDLFCLALYADMPTRNLATLHLWQIEFATSFRADAGKLDEETRAVADPIRSSFRVDPQWMAKVGDAQKKIGQTYAQKLNMLAQTVQADIRRQLNQSIFDMTQRSYRRRQDMQAQQVHQMTNAISGFDDYTTPDGRKIQAPIAPMGQSAWLGTDGKTYNFNSGTNPNEDTRRRMTYERLTPQEYTLK
jgi:hypothetical protein